MQDPPLKYISFKEIMEMSNLLSYFKNPHKNQNQEIS